MDRSVFSDYAWYELFGPVWFVAMALLSYLYVRKIVLSHRYQTTHHHIGYFFSAVILLCIVKGSPFAVIADNYLFNAHVLQLSIMFFVIAPLFILSLPEDLWNQYFWNHRLKMTMKILGHPWLTAISFNGLVTIYFIPRVFNTLQENVFLLAISQVILMVNAFLLWWVIISPVPKVSNFSYLTRIGYIFFTAMLLMPIGIFLLVIQKAHYPVYETVAGELFPGLTAVYDQQLAGGFLKIIQLTSYTIALLKIVMAWGRKEEEKEGEVGDKNIRVVQGIPIRLNNKKR
ncbi:MAG TPA: cytochrome c oxidase assembly protein [Bacillota bacterium]|nr:cytochrome c oxidase assembly protein [Bacillota bacterium]